MASASAVTNTGISFPGVLLTKNFPDLLDARFKKIALRAWKKPTQGLEMYDIVKSSRNYEKFSSVAGLGLVPENEDEDDLPIDYLIQGFDFTITPQTYRDSVRVTKKMREDDLQGVITQRQKAIRDSSIQTIEYYAVRPWNTGFTTTANFLGSDGMYFFDSGRYSPDIQQATWSNLETGALTGPNLATMRVNFRKVVSERGLVAPLKMNMLIVPPDLEQKAFELTNSDLRSEDAMNAKNWHKNAMKVKVWDYLTDTDAWFGKAEGENDMKWVWRVRPGIKTDNVGSNADVMYQRVRMRFGQGLGVPYTHRGSSGA